MAPRQCALAVFLSCLLQGWCPFVLAETLVVSNLDSNEVKKLELAGGKAADITVYLASLGDMLEKYLVTLRREYDGKLIRTLLSDAYGVVCFRDVPAGKYLVEISRRVGGQGDATSVRVGDVRLSEASGGYRPAGESGDKKDK